MEANDPFVSRRPGLLMSRSGPELVLRSRGDGAELRLNATAALLWLLCDGELRESEILARVRELYPDQADEVAAEVPDALDSLRRQGLLRDRAAVTAPRPVLRVAFSGLDDESDYLAWMLSYRYDVLVVGPESIPDIQFFSPRAEDSEDSLVDRDRTLRVFCGSASELPEPSDCDFGLASGGEDGDRRLALPSWCFFVDWGRDLAGHPALARFAPRILGERFAVALARAPETDVPAPATAAAAPVVRAVFGRASLTIGMATYDDYDGVYFTVQALALYHPELRAELEILIVDNHPKGPESDALRGLAGAVSGARYLPVSETRGTAVRDVVFREARTPYVLCLDSHVLVDPGALARLLDYFEGNPGCRDLLQGPLLYDDHATISTHFDPVWSEGMFGVWGTDERGRDPEAEPFEIPMQGLGLFACRRDAWPGLNPRFRGFGGEEGYLHEKFRRQGGRALCLPFLRWLHRFPRPHGIRFPNILEDRVRNYLLGAHELGQATTALESHFRDLLGDAIYERVEDRVLAEIAGPFHVFDAVYVVEYDADVEPQLKSLGIDHLARRFSASDRDQARRLIVERADRWGFESVLILDGGSLSTPEAASRLAASLEELRGREWEVFTLGGSAAYRRSAYPRLLAETP